MGDAMKYLIEPEWFALNVVKEAVAVGTILEAVVIAVVVILIVLITP
jgi:hypothetical protein